jgi:hypothetical protein
VRLPFSRRARRVLRWVTGPPEKVARVDPDAVLSEVDATIASKANELRQLLAEVRRGRAGGDEAQIKAWEDAISERLLEQNHGPDTLIFRGHSLLGAASFRRMLFQQTLRDRLNGKSIAYAVNEKSIAAELADALGMERPRQSPPMPADRLLAHCRSHPGEGHVVKPAQGAGSAGVFVVRADADVIEVEKARLLGGLAGMARRIDKLLASGRIKRDIWLVEDLVGDGSGPAGDLKFYCFYGKVSLVLEIERVPRTRYCWWGADGAMVSTGKYEDSSFQGAGFTPEQRRFVEGISARLPVPFMRIDFLRGRSGLVFGEFTPRPGQFHLFATATDRRLGTDFLRAEGRLMRDLIAGKRFPEFEAILLRRNRKKQHR